MDASIEAAEVEGVDIQSRGYIFNRSIGDDTPSEKTSYLLAHVHTSAGTYSVKLTEEDGELQAGYREGEIFHPNNDLSTFDIPMEEYEMEAGVMDYSEEDVAEAAEHHLNSRLERKLASVESKPLDGQVLEPSREYASTD